MENWLPLEAALSLILSKFSSGKKKCCFLLHCCPIPITTRSLATMKIDIFSSGNQKLWFLMVNEWLTWVHRFWCVSSGNQKCCVLWQFRITTRSCGNWHSTESASVRGLHGQCLSNLRRPLEHGQMGRTGGPAGWLAGGPNAGEGCLADFVLIILIRTWLECVCVGEQVRALH